jgi:putative SOS response-associated peptidase YedK
MPVIVPPRLLDAWLDPTTELAYLEPMLAPAPADDLRIWPVSTEVNRVAADGPQLLQQVALPPTLGLA